MVIRKSHVVADKAVGQIGQVLTNLGWAWERVEQDYGEDILIQPVYKEQVEPFRMWLQIKGTESINNHVSKDGTTFKFAFSIDHLAKWSCGTDLTLLVLWDTVKCIGYFVNATSILSEWELTLTKNKSKTVEVPIGNELTIEMWHRLVWRARVHHYDLRIGRQVAELGFRRDQDDTSEVQKGISLLAFKCLEQFGIINDQARFSDEFLNRVTCTEIRLSRDHPLTEQQVADGLKYESLAALVTIMAIMESRTGAGVPMNLLAALRNVVIRLKYIYANLNGASES